MHGLLPQAAGGRVELEEPEEVGGVREVGPHGEDLMDQALHADDVELAQALLDDFVGGDGGPVTVHLDVTALVGL